MKKLFVIFVAAVFCVGAVSCKKNCICEGKYTAKDEQLEVFYGPFIVPPTNVGEYSTSDCEAYHWFPTDVIDHLDYTINVTCKSE